MFDFNKVFSSEPAPQNIILVQGTWFKIQWIPDVSTGEILNLGVAFKSFNDEKDILLARSFTRLRCFYDEHIDFHANIAIEIARELFLNSTDPVTWDSPQLKIIEGGFAQGNSIKNILERLYRNVVTIAKPKKVANERHTPLTARRAYLDIRSNLLDELGDDFETYMPIEPYVKSEVGINLFLPLRRPTHYLNKNEAATIVSADFSKEDKRESELYKGYRDINLAVHNKLFTGGSIFIVRPNKAMLPDIYSSAEKDLKEFTNYADSMGIPYFQGDSINELAESVKSWCFSKAA